MMGVPNSEQPVHQDGPDDVLAAAKKKERVKARWSLLREALIGSQSSAAAKSKHSMNSFAGFQVLDRTVIQDTDEYSELLAKCHNVDEGHGEASSWDFVQNSYTCKQGGNIQFVTREVKQHPQQSQQQCISQSSMKSRVEALLSHRNHGVDNTGNVRVWDAEATLAGFLLSVLLSEEFINDSETDQVSSNIAKVVDLRSRIKTALFTNEESICANVGQETCNVLELGAGQAGLAGLAVVSATASLDNMKSLQLVLTDGHPKCVENNRACSTLTQERKDVNVDSQLLLWDSSAKGAEECQRIIKECDKQPSLGHSSDEGLFHICLASDCVHFRDFHDGLFATIARTLTVGGVALLCQPKRGSSLANFMTLIDAVNKASTSNGPLFHVEMFEDFHPKVSKMHRSLESTNTTSTSYNPDWHRPLLLVMTKLRSFDEDVDGEIARKVVKTYITQNRTNTV
eukprot:scaffold17139_cov132-Skeletonema_marinoi.AAC.3